MLDDISLYEETSSEYIPQSELSAGQILSLIQRMMMECNPFYAGYATRIAYLAYLMAKNAPSQMGLSVQDAVVLSLFRNCGDFHFEIENYHDYDELTEEQIKARYIYSYAWVKNLTPLGKLAQAYLYFNTKYNPDIAAKIRPMEYGSIIFVAERIVKMLLTNNYSYNDSDFNKFGFPNFNQTYIRIFKNLDEDGSITKILTPEILEDGTVVRPWMNELEKIFNQFVFTKDQTNTYFKTLIVMLDFKSTVTVWHTIHTAAYACSLGQLMDCSEDETNKLFTAAVLHDVGKIAVPQNILEYPGKLNKWEYRIIQMHARKSYEIINGIVSDGLAHIAYNHHERINGKGYPKGLSGNQLSKEDRIIQISDILSALADRRSYKNEMKQTELISIMKNLAQDGEIDSKITEMAELNFDRIQYERDVYSNYISLPLGLVTMDFEEEMEVNEEL